MTAHPTEPTAAAMKYGDIGTTRLHARWATRETRYAQNIGNHAGFVLATIYGSTLEEVDRNTVRVLGLPKLIDFAQRVWDDCPLCGGSGMMGTETQIGCEAAHNPNDPDGEPIPVPVPIEVPIQCELCSRASSALAACGVEVKDGK